MRRRLAIGEDTVPQTGGSEIRERIQSVPGFFVGRNAERERLRLAAGSVRLIVVYGVAGVGKSAFLASAAEELARTLSARTAQVACAPGDDFQTVTRALGRQLGNDGSPESLLRASEAEPLVLCVDDAPHLDDRTWPEQLIALASPSRPLWWIVGASSILPFLPERIDHLVLRLDGLQASDMHALWQQLEWLYGAPSLPRDRALERAAGNPRLLKQLFTVPDAPGVSSAADPESDLLGLGSLSGIEAEVLSLACAFRRPAPLEALTPRRSARAVRDAVTALTRRLLLSPKGPAGFGVSDMVRQLVAGSPLAPSARAHRHCLRWYRAEAGHAGQPELPLEILHHALGCGDHAAGLAVVERLLEGRRHLHPLAFHIEPELHAAIVELGRSARSALPLRFERLQLRAWQGFAELCADELTAPEFQADAVSLQLTRAELEYARGNLPAAAALLEPLVGQPAGRRAADDERRLSALSLLVDVLEAGGEPERAAALAKNGRSRPPLDVSSKRVELDRISELAARGRPREVLAALDAGWRGVTVGPLVLREAAERARAQLVLEGPDAALATIAESQRTPGAESLRAAWTELERCVCEALAVRGDRMALRARARALLDGGTAVSAAAAARLRQLITLADAHEGRALPTTPTTRPHDLDGATLVLGEIELALLGGRPKLALKAADELELSAVKAGWRLTACRARLLKAEAAFRVGNLDGADRQLEAVLDDALGSGYLRESLHAGLLAAALARAGGRRDEASDGLKRIRLAAQASGHLVESEAAQAAASSLCGETLAPTARASSLVRRLLFGDPLTLRLRRQGRDGLLACAQARELDLRDDSLVVDAVDGRIRVGSRWIDLSRRSTLLSLMRVLAATPEARVSISDLVLRAWDLDYHPLRHRARLTMAVSRLRQLLGEGVLGWSSEGYTLPVKGSVVLMEPLAVAVAVAVAVEGSVTAARRP